MSTEAGKALFLFPSLDEGLAAVESEARRAALTDLREKVAGLATFDDGGAMAAGGKNPIVLPFVDRAAVLAAIGRALEGETP